MNINEVRSVVRGNLEVVEQGVRLVSTLTDDQYTCVTPPLTSCIGEYVRDILNTYLALIRRDGATIGYDVQRCGDIEGNKKALALVDLTEVRDWLKSFDLGMKNLGRNCDRYNNPRLNVKTAVALSETEPAIVPSTEIRELVFVGSYAIHHYLLIKLIAQLQGIEIEKNFGVAPAAASILHDEPGF